MEGPIVARHRESDAPKVNPKCASCATHTDAVPPPTSKPDYAVYNAHPSRPPTMRVRDVKPAPGSRTRSQLQYLRSQHMAPTGGWTASSFTPSNTVGTGDEARLAQNLTEQEAVRRAMGGSYAPTPAASQGPRPTVATHNSVLAQDLEAKRLATEAELIRAQTKIDALQGHISQLNKEVHTLRKSATADKESMVQSQATLAAAKEGMERLQYTQDVQGGETVELQRSLQEARRQIDAQQKEIDDARRQVLLAVEGNRSASRWAECACCAALKAELANVSDRLVLREARVDELNESLALATRGEQNQLHSLRQIEQEHQKMRFTLEATTVMLRNSEHEREYLRLLVGEQHTSITLLSERYRELQAQQQAASEQRYLFEAQYRDAMCSARALVAEASKLSDALDKESSVSSALRRDVESLKSHVVAQQQSYTACERQLSEATKTYTQLETAVAERAKELEAALAAMKEGSVRCHQSNVDAVASATATVDKLRAGAAEATKSLEKVIAPMPKAAEVTPAPAESAANAKSAPAKEAQPSALEEEVRRLLNRDRSVVGTATEVFEAAQKALSRMR